MSTTKRLDFSSPSRGGGDGDDDSDDYCEPLILTRRKSLRNSASKRPASEAVVEEEPRKSLRNSASKRPASEAVVEEEPKKKKKKKSSSSSVINRIWNEDDELTILKGLVEYRAKKGLEANTDWDAFFDIIKGSIRVKVSKEQLLSKIRKLKRKFLDNMQTINQGKDPLFTRYTDSEAFGVSMMIWGNNEAECADGGMKNTQQSESGKEMLKEGEEENANAEHLDENGAGISNFDGNSLDELGVAKITENKTAGEESHDNGEAKTDADGKSLQELVDKITENRSFGKESHDNEAGKSNADGNSLQELVVDSRTPNKTAGKESHDSEAGKSNADGNSRQVLVVDKRRENKTAGKENHDNEAGNSNANGNSLQVLVVDKRRENKTTGKESHDNEAGTSNANGNSLQVLVVDRRAENTAAGRESHDDELCAVRDAFETMVSQGLSDYQKKLHLEKLMNIDSENRKELSNEWKALCAEERKLMIKKLRFSAKLAGAANDG